MKITVEKENLVNYLKLINFNGLVKDAVLVQEGDKKIKAEGICSSNALIFSLSLTCDKVEVKKTQNRIPIFDIAQLLLILDRFGKVVKLEFDGEKILVKEKKKKATIRCDADVIIDSESRMSSIKLNNNRMEIVEQDIVHDFNDAIGIKVLVDEIQDLTKNTNAISSSDYCFMFDLNKKTLAVESNNFNNDSFTQEVELKNMSIPEDLNIDCDKFYFNYGLKEVFDNLKEQVNIRFLSSVGMMIRSKYGRIIVSGQQG